MKLLSKSISDATYATHLLGTQCTVVVAHFGSRLRRASRAWRSAHQMIVSLGPKLVVVYEAFRCLRGRS